jgi:lysophospholipase L1-like esterase
MTKRKNKFIKKFFAVIALVFFIFPMFLTTVEAVDSVPEGTVIRKGSGGVTLYINNAKQVDNHILIIGDSITQAGCSSQKDGVCGWRKFLGEKLGGTYSFDTLSQVGRSANRYAIQLPNRFVASGRLGTFDISFITKKKYKAVLILIGVNDITGLSGKTVTSAKMEGKYIKIINALKGLQGSPPIVFLSVFPACCDKASAAIQKWCKGGIADRVIDLNAKLSTTANANGAYYLDVHSSLIDANNCLKAPYISGDKIHPKNNSTTNQFLADTIVKAIKSNSTLATAFNTTASSGASASGSSVVASRSTARIELNPQVPFGDVKTGVTLPEYINAVYKYLIAAGGVLAGIMLAVGGFMYVASAGDSGKAASGKKYITNALVGMVLLASSYTIIHTINPNKDVD